MEDPAECINKNRFIISVSLVKNEEDIIESFVRHNLQFVDVMLIVDNASSDRTRDILVSLQHEGLPVVIGDDPDPAYDQSGKMTRIVRSAIQSFAPDYLCPLDADEFLIAPSRAAFEASLARIPQGGQGLIAWSHYVLSPTASSAPEHDPLRAIRHRLKREAVEWLKTILSVPGMDPDRIVMQQGNHGVVHRDGGSPPAVRLDGLRLGHIPVRSAEQLTAKIIVGRMAYFALLPHADRLGPGGHWDLIYQRIMAGEAIDRREASRISLNYSQDLGGLSWEEATVEDPLPCAHTLRHTPVDGASSPLLTIARSWEQQLRRPRSFAERIAALAEAKRRAATVAVSARVSDTAFDPSWHIDQLYGDLPPFRFLFEKHRPASVLDIGCGLGVYLLYARSQGVERVQGVDGFPAASALVDQADFLQHDLSTPFDLGTRFDLVTCMEVIEHLPPAAEDVLLASIARHARDRILFSAADVNQAGNGHINCRPIAHWLAKWDALGWVPDGTETLAFRTLASLSWFRRNPVVLVRKGSAAAQAAGLESGARLVRHGQRPWRWWDQKAGVVEHPFIETVPPAHGPLSLEAAHAIIQRQQEAARRSPPPLPPAPVAVPPHQSGDHWCRIVMNDATRRLVEGLDSRSMVALEISGARWSRWPFAKYFATQYPQYDVCSAVVSWAGDGQDGRFDIVLAEQVLEHVAHPHQAIRNMHTMLKEGGHLLLTTPFLLRVHGAPDDHSRWTETGIRHLLVQNGFPAEDIVTGSWGNRACVVGNLDEWAVFDPQRHSLVNEPDFPLVVWAMARKGAARH